MSPLDGILCKSMALGCIGAYILELWTGAPGRVAQDSWPMIAGAGQVAQDSGSRTRQMAHRAKVEVREKG